MSRPPRRPPTVPTRQPASVREPPANRERAPSAEAETDSHSAPAAPSAGRSGGMSPKRIAQLFAVLGAVIATITQATSFVDWVSGKLTHPPAATVAPTIVAVEPQSPASLRDYLRDSGQPRTGYRAEELGQKGLVFALTMHIQGEQGTRFGLRWFIVDVDRETRLRGPSFNQVPAIFKPRNQDQVRTYPVWIPTPPRPGRYAVTFALVNAKGEPVAQKLTSPFRIRATARSAHVGTPAG